MRPRYDRAGRVVWRESEMQRSALQAENPAYSLPPAEADRHSDAQRPAKEARRAWLLSWLPPAGVGRTRPDRAIVPLSSHVRRPLGWPVRASSHAGRDRTAD